MYSRFNSKHEFELLARPDAHPFTGGKNTQNPTFLINLWQETPRIRLCRWWQSFQLDWYRNKGKNLIFITSHCNHRVYADLLSAVASLKAVESLSFFLELFPKHLLLSKFFHFEFFFSEACSYNPFLEPFYILHKAALVELKWKCGLE